MFISVAAAAAAAPPAISISPAALLPTTRRFDQGTHLAVPLPASEYAALVGRARQHENGRDITSRGEAHLTVVTPPEMKTLNAEQKARLLKGLAALKWQEGTLQAVCLGRGQKTLDGRQESTYYVVLKAPAIAQLRLSAGLTQPFYPHVTVGFTKRDLYIEDGIKKDANSCL